MPRKKLTTEHQQEILDLFAADDLDIPAWAAAHDVRRGAVYDVIRRGRVLPEPKPKPKVERILTGSAAARRFAHVRRQAEAAAAGRKVRILAGAEPPDDWRDSEDYRPAQ